MHLLHGQVRLVGDLLERRLATEHRPQRALGAVHLLQPLDDVHGHPDRPRLVGERPRDRLADPPGRVGRELEAAAPVELLHRPDQAQRAFLDQVEERETLVAVVLRDRDRRAGGSTGSSSASRRGRRARSASRAPPPAPPSAACGGRPRAGRAAARPSSTLPPRPGVGEARARSAGRRSRSRACRARAGARRARAATSSCVSTSSATSCSRIVPACSLVSRSDSNLVLRQQGVDVNGRHGWASVRRVTTTLPLTTGACPAPGCGSWTSTATFALLGRARAAVLLDRDHDVPLAHALAGQIPDDRDDEHDGERAEREAVERDARDAPRVLEVVVDAEQRLERAREDGDPRAEQRPRAKTIATRIHIVDVAAPGTR